MLTLGHGNGLHQGAVHGFPVAYWSLTYKNVEEMWERLKSLCAPLILKKNETMKLLQLVTGGSIECWSTEKASSARGRAYAGMIIDESGWTSNLMQIWTDALQPMLVDFEGWVVFGGTPNGINDYHTMYQWGQDPNNQLWDSWKYPSTANPHLSKDYLEQIRINVPQRTWDQEYCGEFLPDGGAVFRNFMACIYEHDTVSSDGLIEYCVPQGATVIGMDLGRHNDYSVITVMDAETKRVIAIDRFTEIGWEIQRIRLHSAWQRYKPNVIWIEENFNDSFVERMQADGLPVRAFRTNAQPKQQIVNSLALGFEQSEIGIPNNPVLLGELQTFTIERLPSGNLRYTAPEGLHDDMVISLALAWHGVNNRIIIDFA